MQATYQKYNLYFKIPAGTSRGTLYEKETYFLMITHQDHFGIGECAVFRGLSADDVPDYENRLQWLCEHITENDDIIYTYLQNYPSLLFGWEQAKLSLSQKHPFILFPSAFTQGEQSIPINGLIWMGQKDFMLTQIIQKLNEGYKVLKLKVGALDFAVECEILHYIRQQFSVQDLEIRLDANGAFLPALALEKLNTLAQYHIHSIEQPIQAGQWTTMADLCQKSPIPIALDEELMGIQYVEKKKELLQLIQPQYIILKPSLHGGILGCTTWINLAEQNSIKWWITSALESNIGLNAIAQFTFSQHTIMPQGLGTGGLFTNNFPSPLETKNAGLHYNPNVKWSLNPLINKII